MGLFRSGPPSHESVYQIPLEKVIPNPFQPRRVFDESKMLELTQSVREFGILQPITVRKRGEWYEIIAGERRSRAARAAGLAVIPAIIRELNDQEMALISLIENLQREDLNVVDEARGYERLLKEFNVTQEELANRVGKSQSTIANKLRLLRLPHDLLEYLIRDELTERHARALLRLPTEEMQTNVVQEIIQRGLNVRQTEERVEDYLAEQSAGEVAATAPVRRFVPKNVRIFVNEFKKVVDSMKGAGLDASFDQTDAGDCWEVTIRIKK